MILSVTRHRQNPIDSIRVYSLVMLQGNFSKLSAHKTRTELILFIISPQHKEILF
jgi:hypothetical protein